MSISLRNGRFKAITLKVISCIQVKVFLKNIIPMFIYITFFKKIRSVKYTNIEKKKYFFETLILLYYTLSSKIQCKVGRLEQHSYSRDGKKGNKYIYCSAECVYQSSARKFLHAPARARAARCRQERKVPLKCKVGHKQVDLATCRLGQLATSSALARVAPLHTHTHTRM